jgi:gamma-glutamyltranspeptidase/glutathione hydrolase
MRELGGGHQRIPFAPTLQQNTNEGIILIRRLFVSFVLIGLMAISALAQSSEKARKFMVTTANPVASQVGYDILKRGGNAIDAMVGVQLMLNLVEPQSSGIGGGAFLLFYDAKRNELSSFDGRETAPLKAKSDLFLKEDGSPMKFFDGVVGGRSVGTPGTLKLLEVTHKNFGSLPWGKLIQPTIELAENGFRVSKRMATSVERDTERLRAFPLTKSYFFLNDGTPIPEGTVLRNPDFAQTLRLIAAQGSEPFYYGEIARDIVRTVQEAKGSPGKLSLADLRNYWVIERSPVCHDYKQFQVCGMGPPSSGALTIGQMLGMLSHFDLEALSPTGPKFSHLFAEANLLAFKDRGLYMADSDYVDMPTKGLLDPKYLEMRSKLINSNKVSDGMSAGSPPTAMNYKLSPDASMELPSTSHFAIVDAQGNAVSMTTTIENGFGSRLMTRGFLLNNELTDFSFLPERDGQLIANRLEPGKRPRSSMSPTLVFNSKGQLHMALGSPGGSRIIPYVAKTLLGVLEWNMDIQQAINLPNIAKNFGTLELETGTQAEQLKVDMEQMGHKVRARSLTSGLQGIVVTPSGLIGGADPRREGLVLGQ